ncbi:MAG: hypothetical protein Q7S40_16470 [Opitutaceae bacterium]|nr:hypothetical protein [Opitutaceae bacterium]
MNHRHGFKIVIGSAALLIAMTFGAVRAADEPIDLQKSREIRQKSKSGKPLTPEEKIYLDRAMAARGGEKAQSPKHTTAPKDDPGKPFRGFVPLTDMNSTERYKGEDGGLYGGGRNGPSDVHLRAAMAEAAKIQPLDTSGRPSASGKIVMITHGMSNTTQESQTFIEVANADRRKNPALVLVDCAIGGADAARWVSGELRGTQLWQTVDERIQLAGVSPLQVQAAWVKHARAMPSELGEFPGHAQVLKDDMAQVLQLLRQRFPNLRIAYLSSRTYAGYARGPLNPEPYAYESAFTIRWLIQDQIGGNAALRYTEGKAPLLLWGPYLWADGEKGRKFDELVWKREDANTGGTHLSELGRRKVADQLIKFLTTDPTARPWFVGKAAR